MPFSVPFSYITSIIKYFSFYRYNIYRVLFGIVFIQRGAGMVAVWLNLSSWLDSLVCRILNGFNIFINLFYYCHFIGVLFWSDLSESTTLCTLFIMVLIYLFINFTVVIWCAFLVLSDLSLISDSTPWWAMVIYIIYCQSQARLRPKRCLGGFIFTLEIIINKSSFLNSSYI